MPYWTKEVLDKYFETMYEDDDKPSGWWICVVCEKKYKPARYSKYCSQACYKRKHRQLMRDKYRATMGERDPNKICLWCKEPFQTYYKKKRFCCLKHRKAYWWKYSRDKYRRKHGRLESDNHNGDNARCEHIPVRQGDIEGRGRVDLQSAQDLRNQGLARTG